MSSRSYLSIGDVLTLLRQEFPDVTISKIRFLESQGLVNPERTPSGYRKFYDHDVERLRWVLRQQREHFLPLKVIKDRLDDPGGADVADVGVAGWVWPTWVWRRWRLRVWRLTTPLRPPHRRSSSRPRASRNEQLLTAPPPKPQWPERWRVRDRSPRSDVGQKSRHW